jgi:2-succinyl-6-hydroxy-2,4-cyclohexadiene-1-carboxylate synthase
MNVNGQHYHVEVTGQGAPLVLLHGFTGDTSIWHAVRQYFARSHQVIAIDILGHGQSDKPYDVSAYHMARVADDICAILDALAVGRAHLLGYSMGGRLALYLATQFSDYFCSLILESASPGLVTQEERDDRRDRDHALADKIEANGILWFVDFWEKLSLWDSQKQLSDAILQTQREQRLRNSPHGLANSLRGMGTGVQPSLWASLAHLSLPTQLIVGEHDTKFLRINQQMLEMIPQARMTPIPNAGHTVHLENFDAFVACVASFLKATE